MYIILSPTSMEDDSGKECVDDNIQICKMWGFTAATMMKMTDDNAVLGSDLKMEKINSRTQKNVIIITVLWPQNFNVWNFEFHMDLLWTFSYVVLENNSIYVAQSV